MIIENIFMEIKVIGKTFMGKTNENK